jgi:hypothetical protein
VHRDAFTCNKADLWPFPMIDGLTQAGIVVGPDGRRFADEGRGGIALANALAALDDPLAATLVIDEAIWTSVGREGPVAGNPMIVSTGATLHKANDIASLAALAGLAADALARTIAGYNDALARMRNALSAAHDAADAMPIVRPPFCGAAVLRPPPPPWAAYRSTAIAARARGWFRHRGFTPRAPPSPGWNECSVGGLSKAFVFRIARRRKRCEAQGNAIDPDQRTDSEALAAPRRMALFELISPVLPACRSVRRGPMLAWGAQRLAWRGAAGARLASARNAVRFCPRGDRWFRSPPEGTGLATPVRWPPRCCARTGSRARMLLLPALDRRGGGGCSLPFVLAALLGRVMVLSRNRRNYFAVALLAGLGLADIGFFLEQAGFMPAAYGKSALAALYLITTLVVVMAGRVVPAFTANALPKAGVVRSPRLDWAALALTIAALLGAADFPPWFSFAAAAALLHAWRQARAARDANTPDLRFCLRTPGYRWVCAAGVSARLDIARRRGPRLRRRCCRRHDHRHDHAHRTRTHRAPAAVGRGDAAYLCVHAAALARVIARSRQRRTWPDRRRGAAVGAGFSCTARVRAACSTAHDGKPADGVKYRIAR